MQIINQNWIIFVREWIVFCVIVWKRMVSVWWKLSNIIHCLLIFFFLKLSLWVLCLNNKLLTIRFYNMLQYINLIILFLRLSFILMHAINFVTYQLFLLLNFTNLIRFLVKTFIHNSRLHGVGVPDCAVLNK